MYEEGSYVRVANFIQTVERRDDGTKAVTIDPSYVADMVLTIGREGRVVKTFEVDLSFVGLTKLADVRFITGETWTYRQEHLVPLG